MEETAAVIASNKAHGTFGARLGNSTDEHESDALKKFSEELNSYDRQIQLRIVRSAFADSTDGLGYVNFHFVIEDNQTKANKLRVTH